METSEDAVDALLLLKLMSDSEDSDNEEEEEEEEEEYRRSTSIRNGQSIQSKSKLRSFMRIHNG